jgi:hypothetical protein
MCMSSCGAGTALEIRVISVSTTPRDSYDARRRSFLTTLKATVHGYPILGHMGVISSGGGDWADQSGAQATSVTARLAAPIHQHTCPCESSSCSRERRRPMAARSGLADPAWHMAKSTSGPPDRVASEFAEICGVCPEVILTCVQNCVVDLGLDGRVYSTSRVQYSTAISAGPWVVVVTLNGPGMRELQDETWHLAGWIAQGI